MAITFLVWIRCDVWSTKCMRKPANRSLFNRNQIRDVVNRIITIVTTQFYLTLAYFNYLKLQ